MSENENPGALDSKVKAEFIKGLKKWKGDIFEWFDDGIFRGWAKMKPEIPDGDVWMGYVSTPIPTTIWREILAFLAWVYETDKSEAIVRFYFHIKDRQWRAWAFPQEKGGGMSAREIPEMEGEERKKAGLGKGWYEAGTVHSHCSGTAWQSSTDKDNEQSKQGIHITVGRFGSASYDLHCRLNFRGVFYDVNLDAWFDRPPQIDAITWLSEARRNDLFKDYICRAVTKEETFPREWKGNIIKKVVVPVSNGPTPSAPYRGPYGPPEATWTFNRETGRYESRNPVKSVEGGKMSHSRGKKIRKKINNGDKTEAVEEMTKIWGRPKIEALAKVTARLQTVAHAYGRQLWEALWFSNGAPQYLLMGQDEKLAERVEEIAAEEQINLDEVEEWIDIAKLLGEDATDPTSVLSAENLSKQEEKKETAGEQELTSEEKSMYGYE